VDACYGDLCYVDRADPSRVVRYWRAGEFGPRRFANGWMPPHPTFFVRRSMYEQHGLYREDLGTAADYEMMLRLLVKHRVRVAYIPRVLVHMRSGGASNASLAARLRANRMDRAAWRVNGLRPYPWTTLAKPLRKVGQWWSRPR
jgi:glycosyltransferase